jgi:protein gp37
MSTTSPIEWTDRTWNPLRGCTRVSAGCVNCYAEAVAYRFSGPGLAYEGLATKVNGHPAWTGKIRYVTEDVALPLRWKRPSRIFVNSMSDLFHEGVTDQQLVELFAVMANSPTHTFQVLTKRPERMRDFITRLQWVVGLAVVDIYGYRTMLARLPYIDDLEEYWPRIGNNPNPARVVEGPLPNVWLGVSVEDQATADARIPLLLDTPAAVRFVSYEPALGPVDFNAISKTHESDLGFSALTWTPDDEGTLGDAVLDWVIVGGESGPGARPFDIAWARATVAQCRDAGTPVFLKQLGAVPMQAEAEWGAGDTVHILNHRNHKKVPADFVPLLLLDRKGGDMGEWPEDLRVREFPTTEGRG